MQLLPRGTYKKTDAKGRVVTFLVYSWRSTDVTTCQKDFQETLMGLGGNYFEGSGRAIVSLTSDNNGFAVGYVTKDIATEAEKVKTLDMWLAARLTDFKRNVVTPVVDALTDFGSDLLTTAKVIVGLCIVVLVVMAAREIREVMK
jgi:hypothetical protein